MNLVFWFIIGFLGVLIYLIDKYKKRGLFYLSDFFTMAGIFVTGIVGFIVLVFKTLIKKQSIGEVIIWRK